MNHREGYRQGDVVILVADKLPSYAKKLAHRVLAEGEVTGHKHQVLEADIATLYQHQDTLWLKVHGGGAFMSSGFHLR